MSMIKKWLSKRQPLYCHELRVFSEAIDHVVRILSSIFVIVTKNVDGLESIGAKEQLGSKIRFGHINADASTTVTGEFTNQLGDHLDAHATMTHGWQNGEVHNVQFRCIQFIDHEADNCFAHLCNHTDAVSLTHAPQKIFFAHRILEAQVFDV